MSANSSNPAGAAVDRAVKLSKKFYGFKPRRLKTINIKWPKALTHLGACAQVDYVSDKIDGKVRRYFHEFGPGVEIFASPEPDAGGRNVLIIRGKFKLTDKGIEG